MSVNDISLMIKTDDNSCFYIRLGDMEQSEREILLENLKQRDFAKSIKLLAAHTKSHFMTRNKKKPTILDPPTLRDRPLHLEQSSLGINEDFGNKPDVDSIYEKAKNGDEKSLRLIAEWSRQGDLKATMFLTKIASEAKPKQPRKHVIIL